MSNKPSFASRWSRQKQKSKEEVAEEPKVEPESAPVEPEKSDEEILSEFNLKDPDEMEAGDDFSAFMNSAIPQRLRNRALRKLWLSNPALANLDELVDYGEDFKKSGELAEDIATAYKVGKGFIEKLVEDDEPSESGAVDNESLSSDDAEDSGAIKTESSESDRIEPVRKPEGIRAKAPLPAENRITINSDSVETSAKTRKKRMNFKF